MVTEIHLNNILHNVFVKITLTFYKSDESYFPKLIVNSLTFMSLNSEPIIINGNIYEPMII